MSTPTDETEYPWCSRCGYAVPLVDPEGMLTCRRYAPRPVAGGVPPEAVVWPIVSPSDWCGEFLKREHLGLGGGDVDPPSRFTRGRLDVDENEEP